MTMTSRQRELTSIIALSRLLYLTSSLSESVMCE